MRKPDSHRYLQEACRKNLCHLDLIVALLVIDHGKTSLVKHLTGSTQIPSKKKKRGLTINLGYAYTIGNQAISCTLGFVDVPGHIDFINNMLAGFGAVNYALLVIRSG